MSNTVDQLINPMPASFILIMLVYFGILGVIGYIAAKQTKKPKRLLSHGR